MAHGQACKPETHPGEATERASGLGCYSSPEFGDAIDQVKEVMQKGEASKRVSTDMLSLSHFQIGYPCLRGKKYLPVLKQVALYDEPRAILPKISPAYTKTVALLQCHASDRGGVE